MLPGMDGVEALERIRSENLKLPVLILTARSSADDKVEGLKAGADDYLTKPFHLEEFLLRVRRMLDRYQWYKPEDVLQIGNTRVDFNTLEIEDSTGKILRITPHEANLIQYITLHQDRIVTRSELLKNVWGLDPDIETRTVDTFISRIRRYLEKDPSKPEHIISIRGKGYRFLP
jgi:DNA-binding response OmpR family regulator